MLLDFTSKIRFHVHQRSCTFCVNKKVIDTLYVLFHLILEEFSLYEAIRLRFALNSIMASVSKLLFNLYIIVLWTAWRRHQRRRLKRARRNLPRFAAPSIVLQTGSALFSIVTAYGDVPAA